MTEKQRYEILYEEMRGMLKTLIEGQDIMKESILRKIQTFREEVLERFEITDLKIEGLKDRVVKIEQRLDKIEERLNILETKVDNLQVKVGNLEREVADIRQILQSQPCAKDIIRVEQRVNRLESAVF